MSWQNIDDTRKDMAHYAIIRLKPHANGMEALRDMFPDAKCDALNFVLFSTSGVHGSYQTIEEAERILSGHGEDEDNSRVTFLVVHPRFASLRYGNCVAETVDDIAFLKRLRKSGQEVASKIGGGVR